jgi:cation diffusion facilitator family transporter
MIRLPSVETLHILASKTQHNPMDVSHINEKKAIALSSVIAAVFLTGFKLVIGLWTNSLGILSEAAHSGLDLLAAAITLFAVTYADRPADEDHSYGHGKLENISAFVETLLLIITCAWIIWEAIDRLLTRTHHVEANIWSFIVMGTSIVIDVSRSRALYRVAKKHHSQALEADALHFSSDVWSSLTVIAGLIFVWIGYHEFDAISAIIVALLVLFVSYRLGRKTVDALMDRVPAQIKQQIEMAILAVVGVEEVRKLRIRSSGSHIFVDVVIGIRRTIPFHSAHAIMDAVEKAVHQAREHTDVIVHAEPFESKDETIIDKIRMIVMEKGLRPPHNIEVHLTDGKYFIDFDVEYQAGHTFAEAHDIASDIEKRIQQELPSVGKVTIHLEEFEANEHALHNATKIEHTLSSEIRAFTESHKNIIQCQDITLLQDDNKYNATLTCQIDKTKTLDEVHQIISEVEGLLYQQFKQLRRITIHAEPK